jgi:drug/metabolite transporter (DMT)-like permease
MTDAPIGPLLALLAAVSFACSGVFISKGAAAGGKRRGVLFSVLVTMLFSSTLWLVVEGGELGDAAGEDWWAAIGWFALAGMLSMFFGRAFLYTSIAHLGVTRATALKRLEPFFSVLLAFVLLSEPLSGQDGVGMLAIALAFGLFLRHSLRGPGATAVHGAPSVAEYGWGVGSALAYALSYIARKFGLAIITAPAFATMVSATAGFISFLIAALFASRYREDIRSIFKSLNRWWVMAAICSSIGQISIFAALSYEEISTVVVIVSLEIFISSFLAVVVFRTERRPDAMTYLAAALATAGAILVASG